jgi:hypothetical protein
MKVDPRGQPTTAFARLAIILDHQDPDARSSPNDAWRAVYGGGAYRYTDYPTLEQSRAATEVGDLAPA